MTRWVTSSGLEACHASLFPSTVIAPHCNQPFSVVLQRANKILINSPLLMKIFNLEGHKVNMTIFRVQNLFFNHSQLKFVFSKNDIN